MAAKRALVVDDSKSARAFLSRMLEKHELEVDTAESAEDAIDYLTRHRPDVIFMDHLMPGMDGFQAVQAIKQDPRTATIPILMYTSQEGELYLGQARALGAIGVLPKQIRPADVYQVLRQLHLVTERRSDATATVPMPIIQAATEEVGPRDPTQEARALPASAAPPSIATTQTHPVLPVELAAPALEPLLRDQIADLRRALIARLDDRDAALSEKIREAARQATPPAPPPPAPRPDRRGWGFAIAASLLALVFLGLWRGELAERRAVATTLETLLAREAATGIVSPGIVAPAAPSDAAAAATPAAPGPVSPVSFNVPFGELPLAGDRIAAVRGLLETLRARGFRGDVDVLIHQGRFCVVGNAGEGWSLAPEDLAHSRCDRIGNPVREDGGTAESVAFANMLAEQRRVAGNALRVRVLDFQDAPDPPYPDPVMARAGQWNAAALANNRVELRWRERP